MSRPIARLFHVSDQPGITIFIPRPPPPTSPIQEPLVWAVGERLLHNFLVPRDCPRVTFYALPDSDPADVARLMAGTTARYVVAIETAWLERLRRETLYLYEVPPDTFELTDTGTEHYISRQAVVPTSVTVVEDVLATLTARDVELRVMHSLHDLRDLVIAASLHFSIYRWRNASARAPAERPSSPSAATPA